MNKLPQLNSKTFTLSAVVVGFLLIGDLNPTEQNALGNWFELVGQILETNGSYTFNDQNGNSSNDNSNDNSNNDTEQTINLLKKTINAMQKEIDQLKKV